MSESRQLKNYVRIGIAAIVVGITISIAGALWAHFSGLPRENNLGAEIYPFMPRGWGWVLLAQITSLTGALIAMAGTTLAFLYGRTMTWARASLGAALFVTLTMILFGIVPNEWLTLSQSTFAWTPQKIAFTLPKFLTLNNEVAISYAVIKDAVAQGIVVGSLVGIAGAMYWWQGREIRAAKAPPPEPVSRYGRPLTKVER